MHEPKEHDLAFTMSPRHNLAPPPKRMTEGCAGFAASTAPPGDGQVRPSTVPHTSTRDPRPRAMQPLPRRQQHICVALAAAGGCHSLVLTGEGDLLSFGLNHRGQLGLGHTDTLGDQSGEMGDNLATVDLGTGRTAVAVSAGGGWGTASTY